MINVMDVLQSHLRSLTKYRSHNLLIKKTKIPLIKNRNSKKQKRQKVSAYSKDDHKAIFENLEKLNFNQKSVSD